MKLPLSGILSLMSHSYARWALLLLSSTTFVQTLAIEIPYNDPRVIYTPKEGWCVNNFVISESKKSHPSLGVPGLIAGQNHVQVHGHPSPETDNTTSVSILQGIEFVNSDRKLTV